MEWTTTSTLLHRLRESEDAAWRGFVERFRIPIARFLVRMGVPEAETDDVTQEALLAFLQAYRDGSYDRTKGRLSSWLFGIAYKMALRRHERAARDARALVWGDKGAPLEVPADQASATRLWDIEWDQHVLQTCVQHARREFAADTFRAFELVVGEEMSPSEAARELGVPVKAVYNAKHRVLRRIRELRAELERTDP